MVPSAAEGIEYRREYLDLRQDENKGFILEVWWYLVVVGLCICCARVWGEVKSIGDIGSWVIYHHAGPLELPEGFKVLHHR